jgi:hypothetical protein
MAINYPNHGLPSRRAPDSGWQRGHPGTTNGANKPLCLAISAVRGATFLPNRMEVYARCVRTSLAMLRRIVGALWQRVEIRFVPIGKLQPA